MIAGRLRTGAGATLVVGVSASQLFDWRALDDDAVPANVRQAVLAALSRSTDSAFCDALPVIEGFLRDRPNFFY